MKNIGIIIVIAVVIVGAVIFFIGDKQIDTNKDDVQNTEESTSVNNTVEESTEVSDNNKKSSIKEENFVKAPEFSLEDYSGNIVSTADFADKITVVNSWAVWCPFCVKELEEFALLQEFYGDEIVVIAIDRAESLKKAKEFTDSIGVTNRMTFLLDPRDTFYRDIGGFSMPETIFVDVDGNIIFHKRGPMNFKQMKEQVENIKSR